MWGELLPVLWNTLIPILLFVTIGASFVILIVWLRVRPDLPGWKGLIFSFAFLGGLVGIYVGASKTPVVGAVLPAILTFVTALQVYLFSKEKLSPWYPVIPYCLIAMMLTTSYGSFVGTVLKRKWTIHDQQYNEWLLHYKSVALEVAKNKYLKDLENGKLTQEELDALLATE